MQKPLKAVVFRPITSPFSTTELGEMTEHDRRIAESYDVQKLVGEEKFAEFEADSEDELREEILALVHSSTHPILFMLDSNLNRTFVIDKVQEVNDPNAIIEEVYYEITQPAMRLTKLIDDRCHQHNEMFNSLMTKHGWTMNQFVQAIQGGRVNVNLKITDAEVRENVNRLPPLERSIVEDLIERGTGWTRSLYSEISKEYGVPIDSFRRDDELNDIYDPYVVRSRAEQRDSQLFDLNTITHHFVEERARIIWKTSGQVRIDHRLWFKSFHPDLINGSVASCSNDSYDS